MVVDIIEWWLLKFNILEIQMFAQNVCMHVLIIKHW